MKTKWKMILGLSWVLTSLALLSTFESCRTEQFKNSQLRLLRCECAMQHGEIRQTFQAILKELDGLPKEKKITIFRLLKDQDEKIQKFREEHYWYGGPNGISDLIKEGKITDPTIF